MAYGSGDLSPSQEQRLRDESDERRRSQPSVAQRMIAHSRHRESLRSVELRAQCVPGDAVCEMIVDLYSGHEKEDFHYVSVFAAKNCPPRFPPLFLESVENDEQGREIQRRDGGTNTVICSWFRCPCPLREGVRVTFEFQGIDHATLGAVNTGIFCVLWGLVDSAMIASAVERHAGVRLFPVPVPMPVIGACPLCGETHILKAEGGRRKRDKPGA